MRLDYTCSVAISVYKNEIDYFYCAKYVVTTFTICKLSEMFYIFF